MRRLKLNRYMIKAVFFTMIFCFCILALSACGSDDISITTMNEEGVDTVGKPENETSAKDNGKSENSASPNAKESDYSLKNSENGSENGDTGVICVYICGAVAEEGVYELKAGSRIKDALDMAGGYSEDAYKGYVNLAEKLTDGERIYIPNISEGKDNLSISVGSADSGGGGSTGNLAAGDGSGETSEGDNISGKVNINLADKAELMTLSGIGESKADEIIAYRQSSGGFGSIEEIKNVSGIGDGTFKKLKDHISVN